MTLCQAPKAICPTILIDWLEDSHLSSMWLPLLIVVEGVATHFFPDMDHRPVPKGTYACHVYTPKGCSGANPTGDPLEKMAGTLEPENKHHNKYQHEKICGRLNSENSPEEDPWHMAEKVSETEVAPVAYGWDQQHPSLCPSGSVVKAEPHHADLKLLLTPWGWEPL